MKKLAILTISTVFLAILSGCAPEVGSKKWCAAMEAKPKGDWTANEAKDFAKHCIFNTNN